MPGRTMIPGSPGSFLVDGQSQVDKPAPIQDIFTGFVQDHQVMGFQEIVFFQPLQVEPSEVGRVLFVKFDDVDHSEKVGLLLGSGR